ncbi:phosphotransferase family protein [Marinomonas mediterranea]|jgi:Predicted aminoglycoside phosphotransferase|uniref:Aminoglycoside phosphotransferase n=1 Tax=Marinomonas mediterranea (strain ATCC 700492 / JCM 21426 / NBRC 103028 / MMB-1) TaxID=717774 RepID=F2K380_MARM1|nr:phosphotransferase family protein [Marinomonas mediterranea]ADZ90133.1 aminoglycoside phosphotransferase [Marinomonas mediterranea MMB-1]WCN08197.1 phosphotransferase [Marinomonas mediterranea]WCN16337.1 phosphotransferase [Marinomonas mediterranea MMB-1]
MTTITFEHKVARYFSEKLAWKEARVLSAKPLAGGISRETWMVELEYREEKSKALSVRRIVLRMDPESSVLESNRTVEYTVLRALESLTGFPVANTICNEDDPSYIGSSFMASDAVSGVSEISDIMNSPYKEAGVEIALNHFRTLGKITTLNYRSHNLHQLLAEPTPHRVALDTLTPWIESLNNKNLGPSPITAGAIRRLKRQLPPPPERIVVCHGDFRHGNCMYQSDGQITAVIDWEMVHLGDPLEDLAWALSPDWQPSAGEGKVAGHITEEEAIAAWESTSGIKVDPKALDWWRLFSWVKSTSLFSAGGYHFIHDKETSVIPAISAWMAIHHSEKAMLTLMGVLK